jgi:hypothetical protein
LEERDRRNRDSERYQINPDAVANRMGDAIVVVHVGTDRIFELNSTAARIWELLSEGHNWQHIQETLLKEFDVPADQAAQDVEKLVTSLLAENIISVQSNE